MLPTEHPAARVEGGALRATLPPASWNMFLVDVT